MDTLLDNIVSRVKVESSQRWFTKGLSYSLLSFVIYLFRWSQKVIYLFIVNTYFTVQGNCGIVIIKKPLRNIQEKVPEHWHEWLDILDREDTHVGMDYEISHETKQSLHKKPPTLTTTTNQSRTEGGVD